MADPSCKKCLGTGWYKYDHNHSTVCNACCKCDQGWWLLIEHYGSDNGRWCCKAGCGRIVDTPDTQGSKMTLVSSLKPRHKNAILKAYRERMEMVYPKDAVQLRHLLEAMDILGIKVPAEDRRDWRKYE